MKIASLFLVLPMLGAPAAYAQVRADVTFDANIAIGGEPVDSVDVFYDQLSPYGVWVDEPRLGQVFIPDQDGYVPYRVGHWAYTDVGMVWISDEPFAWATSHYGRWAFAPDYGRWVWRPDTEWGPAWVEWSEAGNDFGWAPLAPEIAVDYYQPPIDAWHYCPANRILDVNLVNYYEPRDRIVVIHRDARRIDNRRTVGRTQVVLGPQPERLRAHRVEPRVQKVDARVAGRLRPEERRQADERAKQRRAQVEQENQRRLAARPKIHEVAVKVKSEPRPQPQQQRRDDNQQRAQQQREENQRKQQQQQRAQDQRRDDRQEAQQRQRDQRRDQVKEQPQRREDNQQRAQQQREQNQQRAQERRDENQQRAQDRREQNQQRAQERRDQAKQQQQSKNEKKPKKNDKNDKKEQ